MTEQEAIKDSIAHWERMVKWAANKNNRRGVRLDGFDKMQGAINEAPGSADCALCRNFYCRFCPLSSNYGYCNDRTNAYRNVSMSESWPEFVKHGRRLIKQLKSLVKP